MRKRMAFQWVLTAVLFVSGSPQGWAQDASPSPSIAVESEIDSGGAVEEADLESHGMFSRALQSGPMVFLVLLVLIFFSIVTWGIVVAKWMYLRRIGESSDQFIKSFWESRSLNDLNGRLADYPYSPVKEVFRSGYSELVRGSQLRDQSTSQELAISVAVDNLNRSLHKAKAQERRKIEKFIPILAISASATPFIGLFGTVWGIMGAFEGIARTGSASLAAVAPGISEALIATALGLGAAIPAVIGYNIFNGKIRLTMANIEGFTADFLNIVERYLVTDRPKSSHPNPSSPTL